MSHTYISGSSIEQMEKNYRRNLINSLSGFKSINLVGTIDHNGVSNLAPFSQIFHVGANPPLMGMLIRPHTVPRHTLENILALQEYTFNHIHQDFVKKAHHTSARWEQSEFEACGLTPQFSEHLAAPYVKESLIKIGLTLRERVDITLNDTVLIIGEVVEIIAPEDCLQNDGYLDVEKAGTITCSGLDTYHTTQKIARLGYAKPDKLPQEIE